MHSKAPYYYNKKKNQFLAAIFRRDFKNAESIYKQIWESIADGDELPEVDQKAINQIQHAFNKYRDILIENCTSRLGQINTRIRKQMTKQVRAQQNHIDFVEFQTWYNQLGITQKQFNTLLKTVTTLQITTGCSNYCRRCNEWALPGVRKHFSFDAVKKLTKALFDAGNTEFSHYGASDPLDWRHESMDFTDIITFMDKHGYRPKFGILTKIPRGSEKIAEKLLKMDADMAVSITKKNRSRAVRIEEELGRQFHKHHDDDELLIPAGLDEDFASIKSSITDNYGTEITPEGAFLIIPTFTSALNPTGQRRIPITPDTGFFLTKRVGREALPVDYFKPLTAVDQEGNEFVLNRLLDAQIENILQDDGSYALTPPGMMSFAEYFQTYESDAVLQRRVLFPTVVEGLREKFLTKGISLTNRKDPGEHFRSQALSYFEFCSMDKIGKYKRNAFSFYLKAVADYLKKHPDERKIIRHLREQDAKKYNKIYRSQCNNRGSLLETVPEKAGSTYELFQAFMFKLLENPDHREIQDFIKSAPVKYDQYSDRFVCESGKNLQSVKSFS